MINEWEYDALVKDMEARKQRAKWEATKMHEYEEDKGKPFNPVDRPIHYGQGKIECIDYIEDFLTREEYIGYLRGNIAKYLHRWRYKNGVEDLKKAEWYERRLIKLHEGL